MVGMYTLTIIPLLYIVQLHTVMFEGLYSCGGLDEEVVVRTRTVVVKEPSDLQILDATAADAMLQCNFRYDFNLHDSLEVDWFFNNGSVTKPLNFKTSNGTQYSQLISLFRILQRKQL